MTRLYLDHPLIQVETDRYYDATALGALIGVLAALLVAVSGIGMFGMGKANDALKSVYEDRTVPAAQLGEIRSLVLRNRLAMNSCCRPLSLKR